MKVPQVETQIDIVTSWLGSTFSTLTISNGVISIVIAA